MMGGDVRRAGLAALLLVVGWAGCEDRPDSLELVTSTHSVEVGIPASIHAALTLPQDEDVPDEMEYVSNFEWSVAPSDGARLQASGGSKQTMLFSADRAGTYVVTAVGDGVGDSLSIEVTQTGKAREIFNTGNGGPIDGGGTPPEFTIKKPTQITELTTYHDTESVGGIAQPGTVAIEAEDGTTFGPFETTGSEGQGGDANAYWIAKPDGLVLPPGTYAVIDSDPKSFAQNAESQGEGMAWMSGVPQT